MKKNAFITFDIDWASDDVLNGTLDIMADFGVGATFFATHQTPVLDRIRKNNLMELGIHPNFNKALSGEESKSYKQIIDEMLLLVPDAVSVRAHALTQNSLISHEYKRRGLLYDLNVYIPLSAKMPIYPYRSPSGPLIVPFFFEDDIYFFSEEEKNPVEAYYNPKPECLKVFNFHPIHVYLNSDSPGLYEQGKTVSNDTDKLNKLKNTTSFGTMDFLVETIEYGLKHDYKFNTINRVEM